MLAGGSLPRGCPLRMGRSRHPARAAAMLPLVSGGARVSLVDVPCPAVRLEVKGRGEATVALHGGTLLSWRVPARGAEGSGEEMDEILFLSERSGFAAPRAIRGGAPVCFPQFVDGAGVRGMVFGNHGFARNSGWQVVESECFADTERGAQVTLALGRASPGLAGAVPLAWGPNGGLDWHLRLQISLDSGGRLAARFRVENRGPDAPLGPFQLLLHTYVRVADAGAASVEGLDGCAWWDRSRAPEVAQFLVEGSAGPVVFPRGGHCDRVYLDSGNRARLVTGAGFRGDRVVALETSYLQDTVVWSPSPANAAKLADLDPGGERHFVCLEPAVIRDAITLAPGAAYTCEAVLSVLT